MRKKTYVKVKSEKMEDYKLKKILVLGLFLSLVLTSTTVFASEHKLSAEKYVKKVDDAVNYNGTHGANGKVSPKSIGAGALSLIIWPGIGQLMNYGDDTEKAAVHAIIGFLPPFRIWSCYDAVVDRKGGVWENRI